MSDRNSHHESKPFSVVIISLALFLAIYTPHLKSESSIYDTLTWRNEGASEVVNFPFFDPGESLLVWFQPVSACSLIAIRFRPMNWEGNMLLDIWDSSNYDPLIYSTDSTDENGCWGRYEPVTDPSGWIPGDIVGHTPLGWKNNDPDHHFWGSYPFTVTDEHADSWIEIPADSCSQGKVDLGSDPFYIGATFYITGGWGFYAQEPYPGGRPYSFFKYYAQSEVEPSHGWCLRSIFPWFEAIVTYYELPTSIQDNSNELISPSPQLFQNYPNPFNVTTDIRYQIPDDNSSSPSTLRIYNIRGQLVRILLNGIQKPGSHIVRWDGKDEFGRDVGSGVYFYQLKVGDFVETRRMLMLK